MTEPPKIVFLSGAQGYIAGAFRRVAAARRNLVVTPLRRFERPDFASHAGGADRAAVLHLAWPTMPSPASDADQVWREYYDWTMALAETAARAGVRFTAVGSGLEVHADDDRMKEPYRSYAKKKAALKAGLSATCDMSWVRLHFMFGPEERATRIIPAAILACVSGETLTCGALARRRRWLHVDDQAEYLSDLIQHSADGDWDVAGQEDVSFRELLALVEQATGRPLRLVESKDRTPDDEISVIKPVRMAPIVPDAAGTTEQLISRIRTYAGAVAERRGTSLTPQER